MDTKRDRILDAAFDKFRQYGFLKTTVHEIARQAQVGKGTIYFYFKSKEEILNALVDRELTRGFAEVGRAMVEEPTALGKMNRMLEVSFDYFHKNALVSKVLAMDPGLILPKISQKNKEFQDIAISWIGTLLEQGRNEGVFREIDVEKISYVIDSLIRSFHYLQYLGLEKYHPSELIEELYDLIIHGLERR